MRFRDINTEKYSNSLEIYDWCSSYITLYDYQKKLISCNNNVIIGHWPRRSGKSLTVSLLAGYYFLNKDLDVIVVTVNKNEKDRLSSEITKVVSSLNNGQRLIYKTNYLYKEDEGSINIVSHHNIMNGSIRFSNPSIIIIDEFNIIKSDILDVVCPMLERNNDSHLYMLSTPNSNSGYGELIKANINGYFRYRGNE